MDEAAEFSELVEASGWNQETVAVKLHTTPATISRYLSNKIMVPRSAVEMLKLVLAAEKPGLLNKNGILKDVSARNISPDELRKRLGALATSALKLQEEINDLYSKL